MANHRKVPMNGDPFRPFILKKLAQLEREQKSQRESHQRTLRLIGHVARDVDTLGRTVTTLTHAVGRLDRRLGRVEERLERMDERLDRMDGRLDRMDGRLEKLDVRSDRAETALAEILRRLPPHANGPSNR